MTMELVFLQGNHYHISTKPSLVLSARNGNVFANIRCRLVMDHPEMSLQRLSHKLVMVPQPRPNTSSNRRSLSSLIVAAAAEGGGAPPPPPLDLTEDNVRQVLVDARLEFGQIFDTSVGMTGHVELAELDGPFVKISLRGRFWHKRSTVLARVGNYLKQRIPEILEVDIEDEKQLDDSPENF